MLWLNFPRNFRERVEQEVGEDPAPTNYIPLSTESLGFAEVRDCACQTSLRSGWCGDIVTIRLESLYNIGMSRFLISPAFIIGLFLLIFVLHVLALIFGWYWNFPNFDNVHHFLGGAWIASLFFYLRAKRPHIFDTRRNFWVALVVVLSFVSLAGVAWEFFEFSFDTFLGEPQGLPKAQLGVTDTMADLFFDLLGGALFTILYFKSIKKSRLSDEIYNKRR